MHRTRGEIPVDNRSRFRGVSPRVSRWRETSTGSRSRSEIRRRCLRAASRSLSDHSMKKIIGYTIGATLLGGVFAAGVAVGKAHDQAKFVTREEVKWEDVGGPKLAVFTGDYKKGPYMGLFQIQAGFESPVHAHTGAYEAVQIEGTSSHWAKGEDGTKAK